MQFLAQFYTGTHEQSSGRVCTFFKEDGFTMIELIMVMILLGIVGVLGAQFISEAFRGFSDTDARTEIYEEGKLGLVRMERELYHAVPNAIQVSGVNSNTITFGSIDELAMQNVFGQYSEINPTGTNSITDLTAGLPVNSLISIFNTNWSTFSTGSRLFSVTTNNANPMTIDTTISVPSPYQRYFVVRNKAIQYQVVGSILYRLTAAVSSGGVGVFGNPQPVIKNIFQSGTLPFFDYSAGTATNNSRLTVHFAITANNESVNFQKEMIIHNVP